jgi:hypothetical protein
METATDPIGSPADLRERWRALMGPLGFGERLLWIGFVGPDRRMHKALTQMPIGRLADRSLVDELLSALAAVVHESAPGSTLAVLLTRPGSDGISAEDRHWSDALTQAARTAGAPLEPLFRANDKDLLPI